MASFSYLKPAVISEIKSAFASTDIRYNDEARGLLLHGINYEFAQGMGKATAEQRQLTSDLNSLNGVEALADGSVPLLQWLTNAQDLFAARQEAKVFERALANIAGLGKKAEPEQPADPDVIAEGLEALSALIRKSPSSYEAFVIYGNAFQNALDEIDVIADYKLLHEELHGLQLSWPDDITTTLQRFEDPRMQMELRKDSANLRGTISRQRAILGKGNVDRDESKWIDNFDQFQKELDQVINTGAKVQIESSVDTVRSLLTVQLSYLNTRLKRGMDDLHLKTLIAAMKKLCDNLKTIAAGRFSKQIEQYERGIDELELLDRQLGELVIHHNHWQGAIDRLQMLSEQLESATREEDPQSASLGRRLTLKTILENIDKRIQPLHKDWTTQWATAMISTTSALRDALGTDNVDKAEMLFLTYRQYAWHFFFDVDAAMKSRSEELRQIGEKLRLVNEELD